MNNKTISLYVRRDRVSYKDIPRIKPVWLCAAVYLVIIAISISYNTWTSFFPISMGLHHDEAQHLHVAYLLSEGQKPYVDFIEGHPILFNHYLRWLRDVTGVTSARDWAFYARTTIFAHFLICFIVFCCWTSNLISHRPRGWPWIGLLICTWAMLGLHNNNIGSIWLIRPDWICYAYTLLGCYFFYLHFRHRGATGNGNSNRFLLVLGGILIGVGNAILPKGIIFVLAFVFTLLTKHLIHGSDILPERVFARDVKNYGIFVLAGLFSFLGAMLLDCYLGRIGLDKWISAVFLIHQKKHIVYTCCETNPITWLTNLFSVSLPVMLGLAGWLIWELSRLHLKKKNNGTGNLILFSLFTIITNLLMPSYTNGYTWAQYCIPSIFAVAAIYLVLFLRVYHLCMASLSKNVSKLRICTLIVIVAVVIIHTTAQPVNSILEYELRKARLRDVQMFASSDYLLDEALPTSLVYLTRIPRAMPVMAHHWGYHFMLSGDHNFWEDNYRLGLGPDPREVWESGFGDRPPDAIAFQNSTEVISFIQELRYCQNLNAGWLIDVINTDYVRMQYEQYEDLNIYVRRDKVPYFEERGWRINPSENQQPFSSIISSSICAKSE